MFNMDLNKIESKTIETEGKSIYITYIHMTAHFPKKVRRKDNGTKNVFHLIGQFLCIQCYFSNNVSYLQ